MTKLGIPIATNFFERRSTTYAAAKGPWLVGAPTDDF
jgi:hypothetical protein